MHQCLCCLKGGPDKDLTRPYTYLGKTEIYSDMLKDCFDLQLTLGTNGERGICEVCVGRLRDASDFKLQVQRSQAELRTQGAHVKEEKDADGTFQNVMCEVEINVKVEADDNQLYADHEMSDDLALGPEVVQDKAQVQASNQSPVGLQPPEPEFITVQDTPYEHLPPLAARRAQATRENTTATRENTTATRENTTATRENTTATRERHISDVTPYECGTCGAKFQQLVLLSQHVSATHTKSPKRKRSRVATIKKPRINKNKDRAAPKPKKEMDNMEMYTCDSCGKIFASRNGLNAHMRTHSEKKVFTCEICNKEFRFLNNFQTHQKMHIKKKMFSCDICNKEFKFLCHFQAHKRRHLGEKPFPCDVCEKPFNKLTHMIKHKLSHKGEKRYSCEICKMMFISAHHLKGHKRVRYYTYTS
ncbi:zinc finger protein 888-like [Cydia pomonella]|uniref:zinc finger protein 888-like n=1 Tax=Cydia pomonella TaxID=82600 RepID=UPI002ADDC37F|nr:zinc finger protein 888-like [Cydia pomonella]